MSVNCPFCDREGEKGRIVAEKRHVYVVLANPCLMPGHLLVVPKRHVERPSELNDAEREELFDCALEFQRRLMEKFSPGCDIRQNCKPYLKENAIKVNHVHYHVLPRFPNDEMWFKDNLAIHGLFRPLMEGDRSKFTEMFANKKK